MMLPDAAEARHGPLCTLLGCNGQVARLLSGMLNAQGWTLAGIDVASAGEGADAGGGANHVQCDARRLTLAARDLLRTSDMAVLCLPQDVLLQALPGVAACLPAGALLVETASTKVAVAQAADQLLRTDLEMLGINPLFAPQVGPDGHRVGWVEYRACGAKAASFLHAIESAGATAVPLAPGQHDALCSLTQVVVHSTLLAFMGALRETGLPFDEILSVATPPFYAMAGLAARMLGSPAHIYWDIQTTNAEAVEARDAIVAALQRLSAVTASSRRKAFEQDWETMRTFLGGEGESLRAAAARGLAAQRPIGPTDASTPKTHR